MGSGLEVDIGIDTALSAACASGNPEGKAGADIPANTKPAPAPPKAESPRAAPPSALPALPIAGAVAGTARVPALD